MNPKTSYFLFISFFPDVKRDVIKKQEYITHLIIQTREKEGFLLNRVSQTIFYIKD